MEKIQRVMVYGNTLVLAGIEASLSLDPDCEVIGHALTANQPELSKLQPDIVVFDLAAVPPEYLLEQLPSQPDLLLIGIDPESHEVLLTGQAAGSITLEQITQIMRNQRTDPVRPSSQTSSITDQV